MTIFRRTAQLAETTITIETGRLAKQANGAVYVTSGKTALLATVSAQPTSKDVDFLPLTVEYQERLYAAGKIPGNYFRREVGRPSDRETLMSRAIDRMLRPLFPKAYRFETQLLITVLSVDTEDLLTLAVLGASAALLISELPFIVPVAAVRLGRRDAAYVCCSECAADTAMMNLVVAGTPTQLVMLEGEATELPEAQLLDAINFGQHQLSSLFAAQQQLQLDAGKQKWPLQESASDTEACVTFRRLKALSAPIFQTLFQMTEAGKERRSKYLKDAKEQLLQTLLAEDEFTSAEQMGIWFDQCRKAAVRRHICTSKMRLDGRTLEQVRPIDSTVSFLPKAHGSALFTRGETQALVTVTLGAMQDAQSSESVFGQTSAPVMLHYNFPPYCVGEVRRLTGPSRREIGHGSLARRGLSAVLPTTESFPYAIRIVSEILESNGSSSMATVCGATLALQDAGVPLRKPVAGIAMGCIHTDDEVVILTDILGDEDHLGDMDCKVVGTADGITSIQMDIKVGGIALDVLQQALAAAKSGRRHILACMQATLPASRPTVSKDAPKIMLLSVPKEKIGAVIGQGGRTIRELSETFNVHVDVRDTGTVQLLAQSIGALKLAAEHIRLLTTVPTLDACYVGEVRNVKEFGVFLQFLPNTDGLLPATVLDKLPAELKQTLQTVGAKIPVRLTHILPNGKFQLAYNAKLS